MPSRASQLRQERYAQRVWVNGTWIAPLDTDRHGKVNSYNNWGCRCTECCRAMRERTSTAPKPRQPAPEPSESAPEAPQPRRTPAPMVFQSAPTPQPPEPISEPEADEPEDDEDDEDDEADPSAPVEDPIPPMTHGVAARVCSREELTAIQEAYYRPQITRPDAQGQASEHRYANGVKIVVALDSEAKILHVGEHERSNGAPQSLKPVQRSMPKHHGGKGTRLPTSWADLRQRLQDRGCELARRDNAHWQARLPNGQTVLLPHTGTSPRGIRNAVSMIRAKGLEIAD